MGDMPLSRRELLQSSAGAVLAAGSLAGVAHAAGSETIKIGMIGCGGRCSGAAADAMNADPGVKLVAMADLFLDRIEGSHRVLKAEKPGQVDVPRERFFVGLDGYKRVIECADVVLIACAAKFHPLYLQAAVDAGKHVFVEKPHAIDPAGIKVVAQACAAAKKKNVGVLSGLHSRFDPMIQETIQRVLDGQIGDIVSIEENFIRGPYGNVHRPKGLSEMETQYANQYRFSWLCGDDVTQSLVHNLDRATWALREAPPVKCHGLGGRSSSFNLLGDVFDHHSVVYHYANGVRLYAFCRTQFNCYQEDSSIILGSRGIAYPKAGRIDGPNRWRYKGERVSPYLREHQAFLRSIRAGKPLNCGDYMARSTLVAIMGQLSCYSGREISWDQASQSDFFFAPRPEECRWDMAPPVKPDANGVYPVAVPGVTRTV